MFSQERWPLFTRRGGSSGPSPYRRCCTAFCLALYGPVLIGVTTLTAEAACIPCPEGHHPLRAPIHQGFARYPPYGVLKPVNHQPPTHSQNRGHTVPCDFIKQDELQKLLSVHHEVLARPLEESTDWVAPSRVQRFDAQTLDLSQRSRRQ